MQSQEALGYQKEKEGLAKGQPAAAAIILTAGISDKCR